MDRLLAILGPVLFLLLVQSAVAQSSVSEDQATAVLSVVAAVFGAISISLLFALFFFLLWHKGLMNCESKKEIYNFDDPRGQCRDTSSDIATSPESGMGEKPHVMVTFYKGRNEDLPQIKESNLENEEDPDCGGTLNPSFTAQSSHSGSSQDDVFDESPSEKREQDVKLSPMTIHKMKEEAKKKRISQPRTESSTPLLNGGDTRTSESSGNGK